MRNGPGFGLVFLLASALSAQPRPAGGVVNPGGGLGLPGVTRSLGSVVNPAQGGLRVPGSRGGTGYYGGRVVGAYPVFIGGYSYPVPYAVPADAALPVDPSAGYAPAPSNTTVVVPPQQPVTPVVINFNYGTPPPPTASAPVPVPVPNQDGNQVQTSGSDDNASGPSHYLIAFKDHTIYAATAYWVDGDTLHYFTDGNVHNQASLALVDRDFTQRLNKEAGLDVRLPAPSKQ
ncbi:MAG TPA: hypothetical protein VMB03_21410 [Bryobacteraceae bacterium]|nr:hypothetical protein [Bryobacteraceae bacterium]